MTIEMKIAKNGNLICKRNGKRESLIKLNEEYAYGAGHVADIEAFILDGHKFNNLGYDSAVNAHPLSRATYAFADENGDWFDLEHITNAAEHLRYAVDVPAWQRAKMPQRNYAADKAQADKARAERHAAYIASVEAEIVEPATVEETAEVDNNDNATASTEVDTITFEVGKTYYGVDFGGEWSEDAPVTVKTLRVIKRTAKTFTAIDESGNQVSKRISLAYAGTKEVVTVPSVNDITVQSVNVYSDKEFTPAIAAAPTGNYKAWLAVVEADNNADAIEPATVETIPAEGMYTVTIADDTVTFFNGNFYSVFSAKYHAALVHKLNGIISYRLCNSEKENNFEYEVSYANFIRTLAERSAIFDDKPATYLPAPVKVKTTPGGDKRYYVRENGKARRIGFCDAVWLEEKNIIETCKSLAENTVDEMKDAVACLQLEIVNVICRKTEKSFLFANVDDAINAARKIRDTFADKFVAAAIIGDNEHFSNKTLATFMPDAERFSAAYVEWKNADTTKSDRDIADALSRELYAVTRRADYMNVTLQSGKQIPTCFGNAFVEPDWNRDNGFVFTNGHETFARYDTPEQVKAVADKLKAAIESGATEFAFPTVDELVNPGKPAVADSLTRAMNIALDCYKGFCYVGNLTAAERELKLYNICRKAMTKLRREMAT